MRIGLLLSLIAVGLVFSCQEPREVADHTPDLRTYQNVGTKIPTETGARWLEAFNTKYNNGARPRRLIYSVSGSLLSQSLSIPELTGVAFHYGLDENGVKHIIVIPVDSKLRLWNFVEGRIYVDANSDTIIPKSTAEEWTERFRSQNPNGIWFHYFGRNIFDEILTFPNLTSVYIAPAINDLDLSPQLLLIVGLDFNLLGRTDSEQGGVYDASYPCPKCAVE